MVEFSTAIEGVSTAESLEELERIFPDVCEALGLSHMVYHSLRTPSIAPRPPALLFTYDRQWVTRYFAERYIEVDPVIGLGRRSFLPVDWSDLPRQDGQVVDFFRDAQRHGVGRHGLTIPIHGPFGERALFTLNSTASARLWERNRDRLRPHLLVLGHLIHERAMRLTSARQGESPQLSSRETQCLRHAAAGKLAKAIAFELGIAERSVRVYLTSARHKLNAATIPQAVASALLRELI